MRNTGSEYKSRRFVFVVYQDSDNPFSPRRYAVKNDTPIDETNIESNEKQQIKKPIKKVQAFVPFTLYIKTISAIMMRIANVATDTLTAIPVGFQE